MKQAIEKPEEYIKEYIPKNIKTKKVDNTGQLDFTDQTPIKKRKKNMQNVKQALYQPFANNQAENLKKSVSLQPKQTYD